MLERSANPGAPGKDEGIQVTSFITIVIVSVCCALPIAWIVVQIFLNPTTLTELRLDSFRIGLVGRTIFYNSMVGVIAVLLALPAAWVIGRGRGIVATSLGFVLPISLLMPSLVLAYGWKQVIRLAGWDFSLAGFWDVSRCIWSLATWLWPVPAIIVGLALRRSDPQVQQQALMDGVLRRVMLRQVAGPIIASACIVSLLAMQEFAVYEPTGISVVATEVRMVFETGAYSSPNNPITQTFGPAGAQSPGFASPTLPDQRARAAASIATVMPIMGVVIVLALVAWLGTRKLSAAEQIDSDDWPRALDVPGWILGLSWIIVALALVTPIVGLVLSLKRVFDVQRWLLEFAPQVFGTLEISGIAGIMAFFLALCASPRLSRGLWVTSLLSFLIGGQILAIALIRLYNHPLLQWVYNGAPIIVMAYIGRFGWIVLAAAGVTWSRPWRQLRDMAAIDGAGAMQTAKFVIWPLAWPVLGASAMFVTILSLSEVPATVLIAPKRPEMLVPMLMTWLHMLRYDAMIEASLLMVMMVVILGAIAVSLGWIGIVRMQGKSKKAKGKSEDKRLTSLASFFCLLPFAFCLLLLSSCDSRSKPQAIWCETGMGPGQVAFPRGIAYSPSDDSYFIVDRQARIQHLDNQGRFIAGWRTPEWARGKPVGLTVAPDGKLFVADTHYHRILVYSPGGELLKKWGEKGTDPGQFIYPTDIAFDARGHMFISEYGDNDRIQVFDRDDKFLYQFGKFGDGPGEFSRPQSMVIDSDLLYVTDQCNHRLVVFKTDGTFVRNMCKLGSGLGELRFPYGLDEDSKGRLIVSEFGNNRVQLIDKQTGQGLATWGFAGHEPGQLAFPHGVAVDRRDRVVAVDAGNNRLQVFEF